MREYGIISPKFWIGKTGRKLRAHPYAQRVALYLMTAPNADMTGVYYCPLSSILNDVGSPSNAPLAPSVSPFEAPCEGYKTPFEGVKDAVSVLEDLGFCVYDAETEYVFVVEMARWQIAENLKANDNRVKGIKKYVESMPDGLKQRFINRYNDAFSLGMQVGPIEAPCKPLRSQEQEQEQEQEIKKDEAGAFRLESPEADEKAQVSKRKTPEAATHLFDLPDLPDDWREYCREVRPDLDPDRMFAEFKFYWQKGNGKGKLRSDKGWAQSWQNWIRSDKSKPAPATFVNRRPQTSSLPVPDCNEIDYHRGINPDGSF